jgi:hypothetical protein
VNSVGATIPNLGLNYQILGSGDTNSTSSLTGTTLKLFSDEVNAAFNTVGGITINNVPFATYDVVVYSLASNAGGGGPTASVSLSDGGSVIGVVTQNFTKLPTGYSVATVAFGTNTSVTDVNTIVFQGLTSPNFVLGGGNVAGFQIVERPYDQGIPASYNIQRAAGANGSFTTVGTASGSVSSFTDTSGLSTGTLYQYRIQAVNSFGTSAYSNTVSVTTPGIVPTPALVSNFTSWQSKYFTAAQRADSTISGPNADPYGSGVPNLLAYALQLNPATAQPSDQPTAVRKNGHLVMTYFVPTSITDVYYIPEVSSNLATWNSGTGYTQVMSNVANSTGHTITVQDTLPTTMRKHFMHLRVTQH